MTFKELREASGMNKTQFSAYFSIPYRTVQDWELGNRKCNDYIISLMEYKLKHEGLIRADMERGGEIAQSIFDNRKKCIEDTSYIGQINTNGLFKKHKERGCESK